MLVISIKNIVNPKSSHHDLNHFLMSNYCHKHEVVAINLSKLQATLFWFCFERFVKIDTLLL